MKPFVATDAKLTYRGINMPLPLKHPNCQCRGGMAVFFDEELPTMTFDDCLNQMVNRRHNSVTNSSAPKPEPSKPHQVTEAMRIEANKLLEEADEHRVSGQRMWVLRDEFEQLGAKAYEQGRIKQDQATKILTGKPVYGNGF